MSPDLLKLLSRGPALPNAPMDPTFDYWSVVEGRSAAVKAGAAILDAKQHLTQVNATEIIKAFGFPAKQSTLILENDTLYWRVAKPAPKTKVDVIPMFRGEAVPADQVADTETVAMLSDWYRVVTRDRDQKDVLASKEIDEAKTIIQSNPGKINEKAFESKTHTLRLIAGELYWQYLRPIPQTRFEALEGTFDKGLREPGTAFVNDGFHWLTYETVLNKPKFRKTNQSEPVGLYLAKLSDMQVWIREDIPAASLKVLCEAFIPDLPQQAVEDLSNRSWWWKKPADLAGLVGLDAPYWQKAGEPGLGRPPPVDVIALLPETLGSFEGEPPSPDKIAGSRAQVTLHLPVRVVMPYNYADNDASSKALGTIAEPPSLRQIPVNDAACWPYWRTASRSCVMRLSKVADPALRHQYRAWHLWPFDEKKTLRESYRYVDSHLPMYLNDNYRAAVRGGAHFQFPNEGEDVFSVKTGVAMVGFERQSKANKEIIGADDEWLVGAMRSDYILAIDRLAGGHGGNPKAGLKIQTEVLSILERKPRPGDDIKGVDGVSVRDLTVLDKTGCLYVPSLSVPFIDLDGKTLTQEFANVADPVWCGFWQKHWAQGLGRAKALFLARYGLQHANPNVQNYLIEFDAGAFDDLAAATSRIIIRDVADALLHREVAWALFGDPAQEAPNSAAELSNMRLSVLKYNFRNDAQAHENETGTTNKQFGPPGTQFLWQRFSVYYTTAKLDTLAECPPLLKRQVLCLLARWGVAHNATYVSTLELALGTTFEDLAWDTIPDTERHLNGNGKSEDDVAWEEAAAAKVHAYIRSAAGRAALCGFHNRGWTDVVPTFTIQVTTATGEPMPHCAVYLQTGSSARTRVTDATGSIAFFAGSVADFGFAVKRGQLRVDLIAGAVIGTAHTMQLPP